MNKLLLYQNQITFEIKKATRAMDELIKQKGEEKISEYDFMFHYKRQSTIKYALESIDTSSLERVEKSIFDKLSDRVIDASCETTLDPIKDVANWRRNSKIFDYIGHMEEITILYNIFLIKDDYDKCCPANKNILY